MTCCCMLPYSQKVFLPKPRSCISSFRSCFEVRFLAVDFYGSTD